MNCQDIEDLLDERIGSDLTLSQETALGEHLLDCESCKSAWRSAQALRSLREAPVQSPRPGFFEETMHLARTSASQHMHPRPFWLGAAFGGSLAAGIVLAVLGLNPAIEVGSDVGNATNAPPAVTIALNETRDVSVAIDSAVALTDAQVRVVVTGSIALRGFDERSISWKTNLDAGINQLTLPISATGSGGGQVLVELEHDHKRQIFVVHVDIDSATQA